MPLREVAAATAEAVTVAAMAVAAMAVAAHFGGGGHAHGGHAHFGGGGRSLRRQIVCATGLQRQRAFAAKWESQCVELPCVCPNDAQRGRAAQPRHSRPNGCGRGDRRIGTIGRGGSGWWQHGNGGYGWVGPLFWPFAYFDIYDYAIWGNGVGASFWGYGYDDIYAGIFSPYGYDDLDRLFAATRLARNRRPQCGARPSGANVR